MIMAVRNTLVSVKTLPSLAVFVGALSLISFPHEASACDDARSCLIGSIDDNPGQTSLWHAVEDTLRLGAGEVLAGCLARGVEIVFTWDEKSNEGTMRRADKNVPLCNFTWLPTTGRSARFVDLRGDAVDVIVSPTSEERSFQLRSCGNLMVDRGLPRDAADLRISFALGDDDGLVCLARSSEGIDQ
ncbi:hypothetical protein [Rhodovulum sp. FJ3]|uniref:hypothetical protein n=1 Tax=Rhodovulum sp. FJ3 TaxID=3079053 RepID=UPI00293DEC5B|nr:hypothetical protein [Rhodovulum sp. FJ3]MDV4169674.1 hypothetical protein [Rhodovulum sp. FJ3]